MNDFDFPVDPEYAGVSNLHYAKILSLRKSLENMKYKTPNWQNDAHLTPKFDEVHRLLVEVEYQRLKGFNPPRDKFDDDMLMQQAREFARV